MKRLTCLVIIAVGIVSSGYSAPGAEPQFQFSGYMIEGGRARFALKDRKAGESSWLELGQQFQGYLLRSFSKETDTLFLRKNGAEFELRLSTARVDSQVPMLSAENEEKIFQNLRILAAAADQYFVERKVVVSSYEDLVGPEKYVKGELVPIAGEIYRSINFASEKMEVVTATGHKVSYLR